ALYLRSQSRNILEASGAWGRDRGAVFAPNDCWALRRGRSHVVAAPGTPRCPHATDVARSICVPMAAQGDMLGVLHVRCDEREPMLDLPDLAVTVGEHTSVALAN